jgi:threonine/homoserine/homoserine lactone efflux protein
VLIGSDHINFVSSAILLLFVPGPTNTLLATRGAVYGFRGAFWGVPAEMFGYLISILTYRLAIIPIESFISGIRIALQIACALYLGFVSHQLWLNEDAGNRRVVSGRKILITTLTNPKAFLFAFVILPVPTTDILMQNTVNGIILLTLILVAGTAWTTVGALAVSRTSPNSVRHIARVAALCLSGFSVYIFSGAVKNIMSS